MKQLMTHVVAGYPDMETCEQLLIEMDRSGVSFIEIQIPFSDPIADGTTIMEANQYALDQGVTPEDCFDLMERVHKKVSTPLLFMSYFNILHHYGVDAFCKRAKQAGAYGLIVPDIPIDEEPYEHYLGSCQKNDLHPIQVISPITPDRRLKKIAQIASGFVYCVARKGTTGAQSGVDQNLGNYLKRVRKYIKLPLAVGFGISSREHVDQVLKHADIAVIGSQVIRMINDRKSPSQIAKWLQKVVE